MGIVYYLTYYLWREQGMRVSFVVLMHPAQEHLAAQEAVEALVWCSGVLPAAATPYTLLAGYAVPRVTENTMLRLMRTGQDILMDWSLLRPHSRYPLLRSELLYQAYLPVSQAISSSST